MSEGDEAEFTGTDPRAALADWANQSDEWARYIVREVLSAGRPLPPDEIDHAYDLLRQEKSLDKRVLPAEPRLEIEVSADEAEQPLAITKLHAVSGVNALMSGAVIEPHAGLTILFGENGTGKTGYSRIFKALADSRTADVILGDIDAETDAVQTAKIEYTLGNDKKELIWQGERGKAPFTRMSIFDTPSVTFHVDDDLEYVYVPAALALFNHVIAGIRAVQAKIDAATVELTAGSSTLLSRFPKDSSVYPLVETLGAATDLEDLKARADTDSKVDERVDSLRRAVAALEANTIGAEISSRQRAQRVLTQASEMTSALVAFDVTVYNSLLAKRSEFETDYKAFRAALFEAADLPADPESTWESFVSSGDRYRQHLHGLGAHDADRCLYCRQPLNDSAKELVNKYSDYLADKISTDIASATTNIATLTSPLSVLDSTDVSTYVREYQERDDQPSYFALLEKVGTALDELRGDIKDATAASSEFHAQVTPLAAEIESALVTSSEELATLTEQSNNRTAALAERKKETSELAAAAELAKSWSAIESQVRNAKEADRLKILVKALPQLSRNVTELSKAASDQLINQSFDKLFVEECKALRAPSLKLQFVGRQGKAQRRKVLSGKHRPSKVLSEGEQKVLAMADFLAEARLAGITAPVVFDDPVSSLDHRRINEVAKRVALLADDNQVIVFTHDIFFATTLLGLFEKSKRCTYFHITDDQGTGRVTKATGPRWDSLKSIKTRINESIQAARSVDGEARAALVRQGYASIRAWCEVFTETELLQGVTQRYQPNVRMTVLPNIKVGALPDAITIVNRVFEDACRYIEAHSQPLATLGVSPTLQGLADHWAELQDCKKAHDDG